MHSQVFSCCPDPGGDIGLEYFQPVLWADKGDFLPAVGKYLGNGPAQALTKSNWTEWNFATEVKGLTGRVWLGLQYVQGSPIALLFLAHFF